MTGKYQSRWVRFPNITAYSACIEVGSALTLHDMARELYRPGK
jgi:hypothetical protein